MFDERTDGVFDADHFPKIDVAADIDHRDILNRFARQHPLFSFRPAPVNPMPLKTDVAQEIGILHQLIFSRAVNLIPDLLVPNAKFFQRRN